MSEANVELVRALQPGPDVDLVQLFGHEPSADALFAAIQPFLAESFEAVGHGGITDFPRSGVEGLRTVWLEWLSPWESYRTEIEDVIDLGDRALVLVRDFGRRAGMDIEVSQQAGAIWTVQAGKIARADFYADREEALAAAGVDRA